MNDVILLDGCNKGRVGYNISCLLIMYLLHWTWIDPPVMHIPPPPPMQWPLLYLSFILAQIETSCHAHCTDVSGFFSVLLFVVKAHFVKQLKVQVCLEMCGGPCNGDLSAQLGPPVSHRIQNLLEPNCKFYVFVGPSIFMDFYG